MVDLTISQGIRAAKKLKGQIAELQRRAQASVSYKTSEAPAFDFNDTVSKLESARGDLLVIETRIAVANATTLLNRGDGTRIPLIQAVRTLQELKGQISWYGILQVKPRTDTVEEESDYTEDMKRIRVKAPWHCDLPEAARAAKVEELQSQFDALNDAVEQLNHVTILPDL